MARQGRVRDMRRMAVRLLIAVGLCSGSSALAGATPFTLTVTSLADSLSSCTGTGSSLNCPTLRSAIVQANSASGSTIQFQSGLTGTIYLTSVLPTIAQSVTITGPGASTLTISGNDAYQILSISSGTVTISGLTFANGNAHGGDAGAIFGGGGALTLTNSTFSGNSGNYGGAVTSYGPTTVTNCMFSANTAENGGGAINTNVTLVVTNSTFSGNSNTAPFNPNNGGYGGGAILNFGTAVAVTNSTFSGNSTAGWGGAIYSDSGSPTVDNNIFIGNATNGSSSHFGAAIYGAVNADHNLYYQNLDANGAEDDCNSCASNTNAITGGDPKIFPQGYYGGPTETLLPQPGSLAICAGSFAEVPSGVTTDQRGFALANSTCSNGGVDVGAVQTDYVQVTNTSDSGAGSLRAAVTAAQATDYGGDIDFESGVTGTITLASALPAFSQSMVIVGPGAGSLTISGNNSYQIFNSSSNMFLSGLTLANGNSNSTSGGGGAISSSGTLTVMNSVFTGGLGGGAGGAIDSNGTLIVTNCAFSGNSANGGGAIQGYGTAIITNSTFTGNTGSLGGGAIDNDGTTTVTNSTFSGNSAALATGDFGGGAIESFGGTLMAINNTFSGNSTASRGGAIDSCNGATLMAYNNIFTGNSASLGGAGIIDLGGTVNASYNLYYQNLTAGTTEDDCNGCTSNTNAITGSDPLLAVLGNYGGPTQTMLPAPGSPAICGGTTGLIPSGITTDQRGFSRTTTYDGTACVDLGAVQTDYTAVALSASGYTGLVNQNVNPAPVVTVTENGQNIGGVPITLGYSGTGSPTGLGPVTTVGGTGATFGVLTASLPAEGTLSVNLPITASGNTVQPAALDASATLNIHGTGPQTIVFVAPSGEAYGSAPIVLTATGGGSGNPVTFTLDPASTPGSAMLSGSTLTILGVGTIVIDANQAAGGGYTAARQVQQSIPINPASLTITASSPTVTYGSAAPTIAPIFGRFVNGETSAVLTRQPTCVTAYTRASAAGSSPSTSCSGAKAANYAFTYVNGSVRVSKATPTIRWVAPAPVIYGTALNSTLLNAAASLPGTFTYKPAAGAVLKVGKQTLNLSFAPSDATNYTTATAQVTLEVNQARPSIKWTSPAAITYSTVLGRSQLDPTAMNPVDGAEVAGVFSYDPPAGALLGAGKHTLSVDFKPTDKTDYTSSVKTVLLTVMKARQKIDFPAPKTPVIYGAKPVTLSAKASSGLNVTFAVISGPAKVKGDILTITGIGTIKVQARQAGSEDYDAASEVTHTILVVR
jgi:predicted outer membrane repeat protein